MDLPDDVIARRDLKRNKLFNFALQVQGLFSKFVLAILLWSSWALYYSDLGQIIIGKVLITVICIGLGVIAPLIDLNQSHATNPLWTGHARFHLVWQVSAFIYTAVFNIPLLWLNSNISMQLVAIVFVYMWLITFLIAYFTMSVYNGRLNDINGVPENIYIIVGKVFIVDRNLEAVVAMTLVTTFATYLIISG